MILHLNVVPRSEPFVLAPAYALSRRDAFRETYTASSPDGRLVVVMPSVLDAEDISALTSIVRRNCLAERKTQFFKRVPADAKTVAAIVQKYVVLDLDYTDALTFTHSCTPVSVHRDDPDGCPFDYKVLIYLNQLPEGQGGTVFYGDDGTPFCTVPNVEGSIVVFDGTLLHASQPFDKERAKVCIGIRATEK